MTSETKHQFVIQPHNNASLHEAHEFKVSPRFFVGRLAPYRSALRMMTSGFIVNGLILLNICLLGIALLWFGLVFSIVSPAELIDMYTDPTHSAVIESDTDYVLGAIEFPAPLTPSDEK